MLYDIPISITVAYKPCSKAHFDKLEKYLAHCSPKGQGLGFRV